MGIKIAINGMGRIGRCFLRALQGRNTDLEVVALNGTTESETLAYLLAHDSVFGGFPVTVESDDSSVKVDGKSIPVFREMQPSKLPWKEFDVDIVIEATGAFTDAVRARQHIDAGAKRVLITGPAKNEDLTVVYGVNGDKISSKHQIFSNASCTTNCLAPMAKVLHESFGIEDGFMTTIHAYTQDQRLHDADHRDLRRARAAGLNLVPTTTGAAKAMELVIPDLKGKLDGYSMRVPVPVGSATDFTARLKSQVTVEEVNKAMKNAAESSLLGVLDYSEEEIVSSDIVGRSASCVFDSKQTRVINDQTVKILGWYDNEYGFSSRLIDTAELIGKSL